MLWFMSSDFVLELICIPILFEASAVLAAFEGAVVLYVASVWALQVCSIISELKWRCLTFSRKLMFAQNCLEFLCLLAWSMLISSYFLYVCLAAFITCFRSFFIFFYCCKDLLCRMGCTCGKNNDTTVKKRTFVSVLFTIWVQDGMSCLCNISLHIH